MTSDHPILLIIDSDALNREIMEGMLEDEVRVLSANSGEQALDIIDHHEPDIIITESKLSDINGFDLCKQIKAKLNADGAVIFLSEPLTFEEKMEGYEAGGDDFLDKPFQPEELLTKVRLNIEVKKLNKRLKNQADMAMKTTMTAMKQSSEMGTLLRFMEKAANCENYASLAQQLIAALTEFGLECCIQFRDTREAQHFNCDEDSADASLLCMCLEKGRFVDIGVNSIVNASFTSILVNNMPITNKERYGEIKDMLAIVSNAADSRVEAINRLNQLANKKQLTVDEAVSQSHLEIQEIKRSLSSHSSKIHDIMDILHSNMNTTCIKLGLTDYQETDFMDMVDQSMDALEKTCKNITSIDNRFTSVVDKLASFLNNTTAQDQQE
ncbi:hypothetical protein A9Q99_18200 [Gammaproteobacteria bacterium 45_16_T64]|nr:hypothetical protein A9Q99_18200 [Gammaproteobacteria bacterium 45_16_T64]